jgi:cyclopropane-fatty-acyl-phospholipid synthase
LESLADFAALVLGPSMAYTCAVWPAEDLASAARAAQERVAARLALAPGMRLLDLSCGWGSFACYAAASHGVRVVGLTRSRAQAAYARERVIAEGLADLVDIRVGDTTTVDGRYDAIAGLAATEHPDVAGLPALLVPGGRLLIQQMSRRPGPRVTRRTFTTSYVFPHDGDLRPLGDLVTAFEAAALEVREVTALRESYALTLRAWASALQANLTECAALASPGRARIWLLYLAAAALACETGRVGCTEICAVRRNPEEQPTPAPRPGTAALTR